MASIPSKAPTAPYLVHGNALAVIQAFPTKDEAVIYARGLASKGERAIMYEAMNVYEETSTVDVTWTRGGR